MIQISEHLTTRRFLQTLEEQQGLPLVFHLGEDKVVPVGYHVTEIKAVTFETVDCGGKVNQWKDTIVQLWRSNHEKDDQHMTAGKFLKIYGQVASRVHVQQDAEIKFEYGDDGAPAVHFEVSDLRVSDGQLQVHLDWVGVRCKAADRAREAAVLSGQSESTCCGTSSSTENKTSGGCGC
ncbi:DUF6428 family protein [Deinococcus roseus]|uniref:Uncharacterized protein n=1 Tax=Deinococcus roseus TaxID=392414 RepID=A0ABQ2D8A6_9DEIO|nr:DUF6428 family protein [Deinococcus roseus]GGJ47026.1 hypothetical protein GCM10008938_36370 [Deinococcus roseus]